MPTKKRYELRRNGQPLTPPQRFTSYNKALTQANILAVQTQSSITIHQDNDPTPIFTATTPDTQDLLDLTTLGTVTRVAQLSGPDLDRAEGIPENDSFRAARWTNPPIAIYFTSGAFIYPLSDTEGNNGGVLSVTAPSHLSQDNLTKLFQGATISGIEGQSQTAQIYFTLPNGDTILIRSLHYRDPSRSGVFALDHPDGNAYYL